MPRHRPQISYQQLARIPVNYEIVKDFIVYPIINKMRKGSIHLEEKEKTQFLEYACAIIKDAGMPMTLILVALVYIDRVDPMKVPQFSEAFYTLFSGALMFAGEKVKGWNHSNKTWTRILEYEDISAVDTADRAFMRAIDCKVDGITEGEICQSSIQRVNTKEWEEFFGAP